MRRSLALLCAALLCAPAFSDAAPRHGGAASSGGGGGYVGPIDIVGTTPGRAYGFSCPAAANAGTKAARLQRTSDSTQTDINYTAGCDFDAASAATFCASTTCHVAKVYNKGTTGTTDDMDVSSTMPTYNANCTSLSRPCMNGGDIHAAPSGSPSNQPCSVETVFRDNVGTGYVVAFRTDGDSSHELDSHNGSVDWFLGADHTVSGTTSGTLYAAAGANVSGTNASTIAANGSSLSFTTTTPCSTSISPGVAAGAIWFEGILWESTDITSHINAIIANRQAYYGS